MKKLSAVALLPLTALALTACVSNDQPPTPSDTKGSTAGNGTLSVASTDTECTLSAATTPSGHIRFDIKNEGTKVTEFYLLGADGLRIVAEKENIAPGSSSELTVTLQPGDYFTACKPGMRGANVGKADFKVTGDKIEVSGQDQALFDAAVASYVNFVKNEVAQLQPKVDEFVNAYIAGDDAKAKQLYASTRVHYERIEPIAEALGSLDPRIDYREIDYLAEADALAKDDPTFTEWLGFHRIEKDLWVPAADAKQPDGSSAHDGWKPSSPEDRKRIGEALVADVAKLYETVHAPDYVKTADLNIAAVSNGASALLEEIAVNKVTGEENWWSHTDLYDFQANLEGARVAFDLVKPVAERKGEQGTKLVGQIDSEFDKLQKLLDQYGSLEKGYVSYATVTTAQQKELSGQIDALREPLSKLTGTVLGIK